MYSKYPRRSRYGGKRKSKLGALTKKKSSAITTLANQIKSIKKTLKAETEYLQYGNHTANGVIQSPAYQINMNDFQNLQRIFGTTADDDTDNKIVRRSFGIDMYVTAESPNNEEETIHYTAFMVSLRDEANDLSLWNPLTGTLNLVQGTHYYDNAGLTAGAMVLLNKKYFKIHKTKRFTLTNNGTALVNPSAQTQYGTDCRWYWKMNTGNQVIQNSGGVPGGNWKDMRAIPDPSKNYYILIFNDNSLVDLEYPELQYTTVQTFAKMG